jgi:hypothetical protein
MLLIEFGAVVMVAASLWMVVSHPSVKAEVAGILGVVFFGLAGCLGLFRLVRRTPAMTIAVEGVRLFDGPLITWSEIDHAEIREQVIRNRSYPYLSIVLVDPDAYRSRASRVTRTVGGLNKVLGFGPANVSAQQLPVPIPVVLEEMSRYHPGLWVGPRWPATPPDQGIRPPTP